MISFYYEEQLMKNNYSPLANAILNDNVKEVSNLLNAGAVFWPQDLTKEKDLTKRIKSYSQNKNTLENRLIGLQQRSEADIRKVDPSLRAELTRFVQKARYGTNPYAMIDVLQDIQQGGPVRIENLMSAILCFEELQMRNQCYKLLINTLYKKIMELKKENRVLETNQIALLTQYLSMVINAGNLSPHVKKVIDLVPEVLNYVETYKRKDESVEWRISLLSNVKSHINHEETKYLLNAGADPRGQTTWDGEKLDETIAKELNIEPTIFNQLLDLVQEKLKQFQQAVVRVFK